MVKVSFHAKVVHGKGEEGVQHRFVHLVLTVAASVVAREGMNGD